MSGKKLIIVLIIAFICSVLLTYFGVHPIITFVLNFLLIFFFLFKPRILYFSNNLKEIEEFLLKNRKNPEYQLFYGVANYIEADVQEAIQKLLKNPMLRLQFPIYETIRALFNEEFSLAKEHIEKIKPVVYRNYYRAIILIEEDRLEDANKVIKSIHKPWMVEALKVELAKKTHQPKIAEEHAIKAIQHAKGLQKYVLAKTFEREIGLKNY